MYYKELPDGSRTQVGEWTWASDRGDKGYQQIIVEPGLLIYRILH